MMEKKIKKIAHILINEDNFVLGSHVAPDGDSLGGLLALGGFLKQMGKEYCISSSDAKPQIPPQYKFMPRINEIVQYKQCFEPNVFISLECPSLERLGANKKLASKAKSLINIDHHVDNKKFGSTLWIEPQISSTCEMLYNLAQFLPLKLNKELALLLYVGIVTDTGRFQYSNVKPSTFEVAKHLLEYGIDTNEIFKHIYESRSFFGTVMLGEVMAKAKYSPKTGLAYSSVTNEDFLLNNISAGETEDFIDFLRAIKGAKVAAIFKEVGPNETKVSLRSTNGYNVAKVAERLGGGGHVAASGYTSHKPIKETIGELKKIIENSPPS